jgi:hypothetical protein
VVIELDVLFSKDRIMSLIKQENSIRTSFQELIKGTLFSIAALVLFYAINTFVLRTDPLHNNLSLFLNSYFIFENCIIWVYSLSMALTITVFLRDKKSSQTDVIADLLVITNKIQRTLLEINALVICIMFSIIYSSGSNDISSVGILLLVLLILILVGIGVFGFFLSVRMQIYGLDMVYGVRGSDATKIIIIAHVIASTLVSVISNIIFTFVGFFIQIPDMPF